MDRKIRVGAVSYLNTKPLIYGLEQGMMKDELDLILDYPSKIAQALIDDEIDLGLVPVAIIPKMKEYHIVSDYCISSDGEVASVCLFSEVPVHEIETVLLDYQSRTSVTLAKILLKEFWGISPQFEDAKEGFQSLIKRTTAAVIIGDRALSQRRHSKYVYDFGLAWKQFTGTPFVFAAWISNKKLPDVFIREFNAANEIGLGQINHIVEMNPFADYDLKQYYAFNINYLLTEEKKSGLEIFLRKM